MYGLDECYDPEEEALAVSDAMDEMTEHAIANAVDRAIAAERKRCAKLVEIFVKPAPDSRLMDKIHNGEQP